MSIKIELNLYNGKANNIRKAIDKTDHQVEFIRKFYRSITQSKAYYDVKLDEGPMPHYRSMNYRVEKAFGVTFTDDEALILYDMYTDVKMVSDFNHFMKGYINSFGRDGDSANLKIEEDDASYAWMGFCSKLSSETKAKMEKVLEAVKNNEA